MRQLISLQQQAIENNARLIAAPAGPVGPRGMPFSPSSGVFGRRGFNPNASLLDRLQYRGVNVGERSLIEGALDLDRARTQLGMLTLARPGHQPILTPEALAAAEAQAREYSQIFRSLSRGHILETFRELVPMFSNVEDAFALLPEMLRIQDFGVLQGETVEQARSGMLSLLRAVGLSGRLIGADGRLKLDEASSFMEMFLRARQVGGRDITADQVFQFMKYAKATGQSMSPEVLLEAFIAMPDIRGSTYGNQLNMLVRQMTGRATQASQSAMAAAGLGTIMERMASGPHRFQPVDEELLRSNTPEWFQRHVVGPTGVLRRMGIDPLRASSAQIATALSPFFSNQSAENIANMIVNQRAEWLNQVRNALAIDLGEEARQLHTRRSGWYQMQAGRSGLQDALGSVAENLKRLFTPALESATESLKKLARWIDPEIGSPAASLGLLGGSLAGGFMLLRGMVSRMGPVSRLLLGGGAGFLLGGGDVTAGLMGAMLGRQLGGGAAAGAAGAAAGAAFGGRFMRVVGAILRGARSIAFWSVVGYGIGQIVDNWEAFKTRMLAIFEDLRLAAPTWLGGEGRGWGSFAQSQSVMQTNQDWATYLEQTERSIQQWARSTALGQWLHERGWTNRAQEIARLDRDAQAMAAMGFFPPGQGPTASETSRNFGKGSVQTITVTGNPITVNVTVAQTNANPQTIGDAAGNAVRSRLRQLLGDSGESVPYGH